MFTSSESIDLQHTLWQSQTRRPEPFVPLHERSFWPERASREQLRVIARPLVELAYRYEQKQFGSLVGRVGSCMRLSQAVVAAAWRQGMHAVYALNSTSTHAFVILPTSEKELVVTSSDPTIIDPTYAQMLRVAEIDRFAQNAEVQRVQEGVRKGLHTNDDPYFIGNAGVLNAPDSGVYRSTAFPAPWEDPVVVLLPIK